MVIKKNNADKELFNLTIDKLRDEVAERYFWEQKRKEVFGFILISAIIFGICPALGNEIINSTYYFQNMLYGFVAIIIIYAITALVLIGVALIISGINQLIDIWVEANSNKAMQRANEFIKENKACVNAWARSKHE